MPTQPVSEDVYDILTAFHDSDAVREVLNHPDPDVILTMRSGRRLRIAITEES